MSALRLIVTPAAGRGPAFLYALVGGALLQLAARYRGEWCFTCFANRSDRARLARVIHLVPSSRSKVGKAILAGDANARLRAKGGGAR